MAITPSGRDSGGVSGRAAQTGLLVAASIVPQTFAPSLTPRSWTDQGIVTGLGAGLDYLFTVMTADALDAIAGAVAPRLPVLRSSHPDSQRRFARLAVDAAVIPAGIVVQRSLDRRPDAQLGPRLLRQVAWRVTRTGAGGVVLTGARAGAELLGRHVPGGGRIARLPAAVPAGLLVAAVVDRIEASPGEAPDRRVSPALLPSLAASGAVIGGLGGFAALDHAVAETAGRVLARALPGSARWWRLAGHAGFLGLLTVAGTGLFDHVVRRLEEGATRFEPYLDESVDPSWIGRTISGGPESLAPWATLGREGRRHAFAHVRPNPVAYRPSDVPDLSITTVMGRPARATPVQVYVGLDTAPDAQARVALAMGELDRTEAWDRSVLMLISPTGTGYVNYCAVAAAQYLTLGDIATVTLQYSKRPSPLSLGRIGAAREQNRLLLLHVLDRLRERPPEAGRNGCTSTDTTRRPSASV